MRTFKQWKEHPVSVYVMAKLGIVRLNSSRMTQLYFIFSVINCVVQVALQAQAYSTNAEAAAFLSDLIVQGGAVEPGFSVFNGHELRFCDSVPKSLSPDSCQVVWDGTSGNDTSVGDITADMAPMSYDSSVSSPTSSSSLASSSSTTSSNVATTSLSSSLVALSSTASATTTAHPASVSTVTKEVTRIVTTVVVAPTTSSAIPDTTVSSDSALVTGISPAKIEHQKRKLFHGQISAVHINDSTEVTIDGFGWNDEQVILTQSCLVALNWPVENLTDTTKEDITFIAFQMWVLGMSFVAILNESILHIITSLLMHVLVTAYGAVQLVQTESFHADFQTLITNGACKPINLLPTYWQMRGNVEIASIVLNAFALLLSAFMSWKLFKLFGWQTFKRIGASCKIKNIYMLVLSLSVAIQVSLFFIVASVALWIDQLYNGAIGQLGMQQSFYKAIFIIVILLLLPWLSLGWIAVRRELRTPMLIFLGLSFAYLAGWATMFASALFRWTFMEWRFFSVMASASVFLTLTTLILGLICLLNFNKGLKRYLQAQMPLPGEDFDSVKAPSDRDSYYAEKVAFPSLENSVPTFSAAFGKGNEVPLPTQMFPTVTAGTRLGPRFNNPSLEPFDPQPGPGYTGIAQPSVARTLSGRSTASSSSIFDSIHNSSRYSYGSDTLEAEARQGSGHTSHTSSTRYTGTSNWSHDKLIGPNSYESDKPLIIV